MRKMLLLLSTLLVMSPVWAALNAHEEARINAMLAELAKQQDIVFVRNGSEHNSAEAVSHLQLKLKNTRKRINSAEQFVDKVASSSSISGKPYLVKRGDQQENAQVFLRRLLAESDKTLAQSAPSS
ncbi:YfeK family protein [Entomohabitans teleogrylli]|uniref:YfeK family protein n=1 Tax=Entomohabitans teleogrylli TaxID=1384589 RepID=UPI00073D239C|nr:YfeK family protein [Entomohabitans teleogrylli]